MRFCGRIELGFSFNTKNLTEEKANAWVKEELWEALREAGLDNVFYVREMFIEEETPC